MNWIDVGFKDADWILSAQAMKQYRTAAATSNFNIRGYQCVPCESKMIRDQFPGDPWIHFCNNYCEVHLFF